jgi:hypothetical protein
MQALFLIMQLVGFVLVILMSQILQIPMLIKQRRICNVVFYIGMAVFFIGAIPSVVLMLI